jgi:hypothetical protein
MRTPEKFDSVWQELTFWLNFHKKPVWLVARKDDYALSVIKPEPHELPYGTAANFYDVGFEILETVQSSQKQ